MTRIHKLLGVAAAALMMIAVQAAPAKAQFAGGGGEDMMAQMAPMLNMMKAKMGKKRFGMLMQTMGPMMSKMMDGSGGGFGGMSFGGFGGTNFGSFGGGYSTQYAGTPYIGGGAGTATSSYVGGGLPFIGGIDGFNAGDVIGMIPQLMSLAGTGTHHRRHAHHKG